MTNQCPDTGKSMTGAATSLEGAPVITRTDMQSTMKLSATKLELDSMVTTAQDMLYVKDTVESMDLEVETPMSLWSDNKGVVDIANGWTTGGRTRHMALKCHFLRELVESGLIQVRFQKGTNMQADLFTKNLARPDFKKLAKYFVGKEASGKAKTG